MRLQRTLCLLAAASSATCALTLTVAGTSASGGFSVLEESAAVVVKSVPSRSFGSGVATAPSAPADADDVVDPPTAAAFALLDSQDSDVLGKHLRKAYKSLQGAEKRFAIVAKHSAGVSLSQTGMSASKAAMMQEQRRGQEADRLEKKLRKELGKAQTALGSARNDLQGDMSVAAGVAVEARTAMMDGNYAMSLFNAGVEALRDGRHDDMTNRLTQLKSTLNKMDKDIKKVL